MLKKQLVEYDPETLMTTSGEYKGFVSLQQTTL